MHSKGFQLFSQYAHLLTGHMVSCFCLCHTRSQLYYQRGTSAWHRVSSWCNEIKAVSYTFPPTVSLMAGNVYFAVSVIWMRVGFPNMPQGWAFSAGDLKVPSSISRGESVNRKRLDYFDIYVHICLKYLNFVMVHTLFFCLWWLCFITETYIITKYTEILASIDPEIIRYLYKFYKPNFSSLPLLLR